MDQNHLNINQNYSLNFDDHQKQHTYPIKIGR